MIVCYDEDSFSIKLYRDFVKGELVGFMEVIPIDELLDVWADRKTEPQTSGVVWTDTEIPTYKTTSASTEPQTERSE